MSIVLDDLTAQLDTLTKAVLSQPLARIGCSRVTIRPLSLRGKAFFQLEYQQGQKVTHRNVTKGELPGCSRRSWTVFIFRPCSAPKQRRASTSAKRTAATNAPRKARRSAPPRRRRMTAERNTSLPRARTFPRSSTSACLRRTSASSRRSMISTSRSTALSSWWTTPSAPRSSRRSPFSTSAAANRTSRSFSTITSPSSAA